MNTRGTPGGEEAREEVEKFLNFLWQPGEVRELRILKQDRFNHTAAGWFRTPEELAAAALDVRRRRSW